MTGDGAPTDEPEPVLPRRFVPVEVFIAAFRSAPALDPPRVREEVDTSASQDPAPRGLVEIVAV